MVLGGIFRAGISGWASSDSDALRCSYPNTRKPNPPPVPIRPVTWFAAKFKYLPLGDQKAQTIMKQYLRIKQKRREKERVD